MFLIKIFIWELKSSLTAKRIYKAIWIHLSKRLFTERIRIQNVLEESRSLPNTL